MKKYIISKLICLLIAITLICIPTFATTKSANTKAYYSATKLSKNFGSKTNPQIGTKPITIPKPAVNGFIYGDFATFNSLSSENKLGGTPIYILGTIKSVEKLAVTGDIYYGAFMIDDCDGYQWCATMDIQSSNFAIIQHKYTGMAAYVYGLYRGYSKDLHRPLLDISLIANAVIPTDTFVVSTTPITTPQSNTSVSNITTPSITTVSTQPSNNAGENLQITNTQNSTEEYTSNDGTSFVSSGLSNNLVWIPTDGGKKYHTTSTCSNMLNPKQVTREEAESEGFTPCQKKNCYGN